MVFDRAKLQGSYGSRQSSPLLTEGDVVSNYSTLFTSNLRNLHKGSVINKNKPFYAYVIDNPSAIKSEELYLYNEFLNLTSYEARETGELVNLYPVRVPYLHENLLPDPAYIADEKVKRNVINCHTLCTIDPTRVSDTFSVSPGTLVKIQFTSNDYSRAHIIGVAGGTGGGLLGEIGTGASYGYGGTVGTEGNSPGQAKYLDSMCTRDIERGYDGSHEIKPVGKEQSTAIALGASMFNTAAPMITSIRRKGAKIDVSSNQDKIANCYLKMQLGGTRLVFLEEQIAKVMKYPQEMQKYTNYKYVFMNAPSGNDTALELSAGGQPRLDRKTREYASPSGQARIAKLKQDLRTIFPNAIIFLIRPSYGWPASSSEVLSRATNQQSINFIKDSGFGNYFYVIETGVQGDHHVSYAAVADLSTVIADIIKTGNFADKVFSWSKF